MTEIVWYPNGPQDDETAERFSAENLAAWVVANKHKLNADIYVWRDQISNETRVTDITDDVLTETDTVFYVSEKPNGPETWIPLIISVVVGVASAVLFSPNIDVPEGTNSNKSSSNALQQRGNAPRVGKRLPDIRGTEPKAFADLWMSYTKFERNVEYEISYLCLSVGECAVSADTVVDGDTLLSAINGSSAQFYKPFQSPNSGDAPFLQIGDVITDELARIRQSNEVTGATLVAPNDGATTGQFSASSAGVITILFDNTVDFRSLYVVGDDVEITDFYTFFEQTSFYTRADASGVYEVTAITQYSITVDISTNPGPWVGFDGNEILTHAWQDNNFPAVWQIVNPNDTDYTRVEWVPGIQPEVNGLVGPFDCSNTADVWLNIVAPSGIYKKKTVPVYFTIDLTVTFRNKDTPSQTVVYPIEMFSNREDPVQNTFEFTVPYTNCEIEVERISPTDLEFNGSVVDEIKWRDLYLADPVTVDDFGNVTTIFAKTIATDSALRVKDRKLACEATRYITRPDNTYIASDNMADVIYSLHTDPFIGRRTESSIDHAGLYALQTQIINYFGRADAVRVGYTFDDDTYRYEDHLFLICGAVNVSPYQVGSTIKFHFEGPQEFSTQQFGHRSKLPTESGGSEQRTRLLHPNKDYDGVELTYKDITTGDYETIYIPDDQSAVNPDIQDYNGCFIEQNAMVHANRLRQKQKYERVIHKFTALDKARLLAQGQRVDVIDNTRAQTNDGYIDEIDGLKYYISQPSDLTGVASIVITKRDGSVEGIPCTINEGGRSVTLDYPPAESPYVGYLADRSEYSLSADNLRTSLAMLVKTIEPSDVDNVVVTCGNYDERFYSEDLL